MRRLCSKAVISSANSLSGFATMSRSRHCSSSASAAPFASTSTSMAAEESNRRARASAARTATRRRACSICCRPASRLLQRLSCPFCSAVSAASSSDAALSAASSAVLTASLAVVRRDDASSRSASAASTSDVACCTFSWSWFARSFSKRLTNSKLLRSHSVRIPCSFRSAPSKDFASVSWSHSSLRSLSRSSRVSFGRSRAAPVPLSNTCRWACIFAVSEAIFFSGSRACRAMRPCATALRLALSATFRKASFSASASRATVSFRLASSTLAWSLCSQLSSRPLLSFELFCSFATSSSSRARAAARGSPNFALACAASASDVASTAKSKRLSPAPPFCGSGAAALKASFKVTSRASPATPSLARSCCSSSPPAARPRCSASRNAWKSCVCADVPPSQGAPLARRFLAMPTPKQVDHRWPVRLCSLAPALLNQ
mmetsp:Transcript_2596/g.5654  ORF Transcript_2596/g.5654 Transcript_2596/m.5654 type:complete len:433 (-) Transcript_2596:7-1305(-)